jgi:CheY-like chemotaxis protein
MYLLLHNSSGPFAIGLASNFIPLNIKAFYLKIDEGNYLYKSNSEEYFANLVSEVLDKEAYKDVKAVLIDKNLGGSGWSRAMKLAGHFACSNYFKCCINKVPIILTDWSDLDIEDISLRDTVINNFFQTEGFYFKKYEDIFSLKTDKISASKLSAIDFEIKKLKCVTIDNLNVTNPYDNRHQSTNEWGAMRLASNFGVFNSISFSYPKHLYFKYLANFIKTNSTPEDKSINNLFNRVLLIDDNADCGWVELLKNIHNCPVDKRISCMEVLAWQNAAPEKFEQYDLIYLDLYLEKGKADSSSALSTLQFIKKNFPHIPVIIFTASDKAWNLDAVLEKGADAMYVKESPIYYRNGQYSLKNYQDFKDSITYVHEKYKILRPYWLLIKKVISHASFKALENSPRKIRDRIEERLRMFYGLLKKGYEQRDYDKETFFYSDYELAYMTLWSVFNEIQEANYDKSNISIMHTDGKNYNSHPDKKPLSYKQKWILKKRSKIFIDNTIQFTGSQMDGSPRLKSGNKYEIQFDLATSDLLYNNKSPHYSIDSKNNFPSNDYVTKSIAAQIAYIILNTPSHTSQQLENLYRLNDIRNSMYLTHGNSFNDDFYNKTERSKRSISTISPHRDIKDLFNLVSFLLTEDASNVIML